MAKKLTTSDFIAKAKAVHGDKYDYSKVVYVNTNTKVIITCPKHGDFPQKPSKHLAGQNCGGCVGGKRNVTTEDFIKRSRKIHEDKYDYSKVVYVKNIIPVIIICPEHGVFKQKPAKHLIGRGCIKCKGGIRYTTDVFVQEARAKHGDKYDYSKVDYVNNHTNVIIICPEHGETLQKPMNHLSNGGCQKCAGRGLTTKDFINASKKVHGDKYDYSKTKYVNGKTKLIIICLEHGEFLQNPYHHTHGVGCPKCHGMGFVKLSIEEAQKIVRKNNIRTQKEYAEWWHENKDYCQRIGMPSNVEEYYKSH